MKKKRERLFKDKDILIPVEDKNSGDVFKFLSHRAKSKKRNRKVVAFVMPSKVPIRPEKSMDQITPIPCEEKEQAIRMYKVTDAKYIGTENKKDQINLIFKKNKTYIEQILMNINYILKSFAKLPKYLNKLFQIKHSDIKLIQLTKERKNERLIALGPFWSSTLGTFIFRTTANSIAVLLIAPLLLFKRRYYLADVPNVERLGHAVANVDVLQAEYNHGMYKTKKEERKLIIFYPQISAIEDIGFVYFPNVAFIKQIIKLFSINKTKVLYLHPWIEKALKRALLKSGSSFINTKEYGHRDIFNIIRKTSPIFTMSRIEEKKCYHYFEEKNFNLDRPLILCSNRSSGNINYNKSNNKLLSEHKRYGYRNSPFELLIPSIQNLLSKGYNVIKVGAASGKHVLTDERYFDFSAEPATEKRILLDLFLFSRCLFFIGDTSGNYSLAQAFRKPICFYNFAPLGHFHSWDKKSLTIFKNIKNIKTGKLKEFRQLLRYQYGYEIHNDKSNLSQKYICNTKKEILETVKEMEARISGGSYNTDEGLQRKFQTLFTPSYLHQSVNARCGDFFLKKYEHLL
jgi:putative glycosyltransferase (TIGR04372 family)